MHWVSFMFKAFMALCRVSNLPTVWGNVLCASMLVFGAWSLSINDVTNVLVLLLSLSCFYCGGMVLNDICDEEYDREFQRFRPIPSGLVSRPEAKYFAFILFFIAIGSLLALPSMLGLLSSLFLAVCIFLYDVFHKRHIATVLFMAMARSGVYIVVAYALVGDLPTSVLIIAFLQGGYVLLLTLIARLESKVEGGRYSWPVIPWMIAAIPFIDGLFLSFYFGVLCLFVGLGLMLLTRFAQRYVRGD